MTATTTTAMAPLLFWTKSNTLAVRFAEADRDLELRRKDDAPAEPKPPPLDRTTLLPDSLLH